MSSPSVRAPLGVGWSQGVLPRLSAALLALLALLALWVELDSGPTPSSLFSAVVVVSPTGFGTADKGCSPWGLGSNARWELRTPGFASPPTGRLVSSLCLSCFLLLLLFERPRRAGA